MVLVAEKEDALRKWLVHIVEQAGFKACATGRGAQCIYWVNTDDVSLVLLDVSLRDGNGFDVLKEIHSRHPDIPVVVITGVRSSTAEMLGLSMGACAYMAGPMRDWQVSSMVRRYVRREPSAPDVSAPRITASLHGPELRPRRIERHRYGARVPASPSRAPHAA